MRLPGKSCLTLGVDVGASFIKTAVMDHNGRVLWTGRYPTRVGVEEPGSGSPQRESPTGERSVGGGTGAQEAALRAIVNAIEENLDVIRKTRATGDREDAATQLLGIGVGIPGVVDRHSGHVRYAPNLSWRDVALGAALRERFGLPFAYDRDVNMAAFAEMWFGAARGLRSFAFVGVGTGIAAAVLLEGRLVYGLYEEGGEIGHTLIAEDGPQCGCGNRGCLETLAACGAIIRLARESVARGTAPGIAALAARGTEGVTVEVVGRAAREGDREAERIIRTVGSYLGIGVVNLVNTVAPETVVIGGGIIALGDQILEPVRAMLRSRAHPMLRERVRVIAAEIGPYAGAIGSAAMAYKAVAGHLPGQHCP